jgi:hypothetical protein
LRDFLQICHAFVVLFIAAAGAIKVSIFIIPKLFAEPPGRLVIWIICLPIWVIFYLILGAITKLFKVDR